MICAMCNKRKAIQGELYCVFCEEMIYEARCERAEEERRRKEFEGEGVE